MKKLKNLFSIRPHLHFLDFLYENGTKLYGVKPVFILFTMLLMATVNLKAGEPVVIMPVGNSITAGEHYGYPEITERTGYRKDLYEMLVDSGYNVDFVGSQLHGQREETDSNWYDWNNEGYPGWKIPEIAGKVNNALKAYKPDILLVHVGTNGSDWDKKPGQVMTMLDSINKYSVENDHPITVFLCKIINRYYTLDQAPTSQFNIDLADTVATRTGDKIKIIMIDMENGAGIDYTDSLPDPNANPPYEGGDFWGYTYPDMTTKLDKYHPNDKGNTKMAVKFFEELVKELDPPETIENNTVEGIEIKARSDSSILITWAANFLDEDGYIVERAKSGVVFTIVDTADANTRYLIDTVAIVTNEYKYRVKAFNASGESLNSTEVIYTPVYYVLTLSVIGQGDVSPSSGSSYLAGTGTIVTLTATAAEGWKFKRWSGDITYYTTKNPTTITMDSDKSITCNFEEIPSQVSAPAKSENRFYPNPVTDRLIIELQNEFLQMAVIQLFDNTGRLILNKKVKGLNHILEMGNLSQGIYLIKVSDNNEKSIIKYITKQ